MRVISGILKGKKIEGHNLDGTRPTMDRVKESIINSIKPYLNGSRVLDLFAGSGNLAIEAYSNGATEIYLNDKSKEALKVINYNISNLGINASVFNLDYLDMLGFLKDKDIKMDVVFLDPPYDMNIVGDILSFLDNNILSDRGIVVCEYRNISETEYSNLELIKNKRYGDKFVSIYRRENEKSD